MKFCNTLVLYVTFALASSMQAGPPDKPLYDFGPDLDTSRLRTDDASIRIVPVGDAHGLEVTSKADAAYPGVHLTPPDGSWDLSAYRGLAVTVANTGDARQSISLRVDNPGDWRKEPWNAETSHGIAPGETRTIRVTFGQSWGQPGYALDPSKVVDVLVFTSKSKTPQTFVIRSLHPVGSAAVKDDEHTGGGAKVDALIDLASAGAADRFIPTSDQVTIRRAGEEASDNAVAVTIVPGQERYPGVRLTPPSGPSWDLSSFGHVEARVVNTGAKRISVSLRVDNAGDWRKNPWNTERVSLNPGQAGTIKVIFGYAYGYKRNFRLNPAAVTQVMLFTGKSNVEQSFRIESLAPGGPAGEKPPIKPDQVRTRPTDGYILGRQARLDADKQISARQGAAASVDASGLRIELPAKNDRAAVQVKPSIGRWDLREYLRVRVQVRNAGQSPVTPRIRLESNGGPTPWMAADGPLEPGAAVELVAPFTMRQFWNGEKDAAPRLTSDAVSGITIMAAKSDKQRVLLIESIRADAPPPPDLPDWLGRRPPVEGDWTLTFEDNFDGDSIDLSRWNIYTENFWDKRSHFTKDNIIVGDGVVRLRMERKRGHENDDPSRKQTDYAVGFLDTYGMWTQRYGYFEARMKLPTAPGLWPAFWMMPDRGVEVGPQWKRADTKHGGMELDIMEHLTRWGPHRYNIALHWDGYGKEHKHLGSDKVYFQPDADGFITAGLLWLPGSVTFYCNGRPVMQWDNPRVSNVPSYLIFDMVTGGWDNSPLDDARLPDDFIIDYVRAWQREDLRASADATADGQARDGQ